MIAQTIFYIIIGILVFDFILDKFLDYLNARHYNDKLPSELQDVYDVDEYKKSQAYKLTNNKFPGFRSLSNVEPKDITEDSIRESYDSVSGLYFDLGGGDKLAKGQELIKKLKEAISNTVEL